MAKIVTIGAGTHHLEINQLNDLVSIVDDDVILGVAYSSFTVINVPGIQGVDIKRVLEFADIYTLSRNKFLYRVNMSDSDRMAVGQPQESLKSRLDIIKRGFTPNKFAGAKIL